MKNEFKLIEVFDPNGKPIEEKLKEVFIAYLTEKLNEANDKRTTATKVSYIGSYKDI